MRAAELGVGVHEMKSYVAHDDVEQWQPLVGWLAGNAADSGPPAADSGGGGGDTGETAAITESPGAGNETMQMPPSAAVANA